MYPMNGHVRHETPYERAVRRLGQVNGQHALLEFRRTLKRDRDNAGLTA